MRSETGASDAHGPCPVCLELDGTCRRCVQLGVRALGLVEAGESVGAIAVRLRLSPARVARLVEITRDRRSVEAEKKKRPRVADAHALIERELARHPELNRAEIARRMRPRMHPSDFDRAFGYARSGPPRRFISLAMADRLTVALDLPPNTLPGC